VLRTWFGDTFVVSPAARLRLGSLLDEEHPGWFPPELARKDLRLAISLAERSGVPVRITPAAEELLTTVISTGKHWPDFTALIEALK
jgi:3-hydroxyisobutyrate dehydrogenase-like beta-hydroxyacid dehydrogenase